MRLIDADKLQADIDSLMDWDMFKSDAPNPIDYADITYGINQAPTVMQWVSVKDKLPEERTSNLVVTNPEKKHIWIAFYCKNRFDQQEWRIDGDCLKTDKISHWMPLPPPPGK